MPIKFMEFPVISNSWAVVTWKRFPIYFYMEGNKVGYKKPGLIFLTDWISNRSEVFFFSNVATVVVCIKYHGTRRTLTHSTQKASKLVPLLIFLIGFPVFAQVDKNRRRRRRQCSRSYIVKNGGGNRK